MRRGEDAGSGRGVATPPFEGPAREFGGWMREHLARVENANAPVLDEVAALLLEVVRRDALVYTAGTGHSMALVLETFYRAGGLACVYPLYHPAFLPLEGGAASTVAERTGDLAQALLAHAAPREKDISFVFSNSGVNPVPVELAAALRETGCPVVGVVSVPHMTSVPARAGRKLGDVASHLLDTMISPGDLAFRRDGASIAAMSSLTSVFLWNLLLGRLFERARAAAVELPVWTSSNVPEGDERNASLITRYRSRIPLL